MDSSLCSLFLAFIAILLSIVPLLILYARWHYGTLEKLGLPVVKPHFVLGSTFPVKDKPIGYRDIDWMKQHGPVFGIYKGREPVIMFCDPEILRLVMVKDFAHFDQQGPVDFGDSFLNEIPDYLPEDKWKIVRRFTSPVFTIAKLRLMNTPMKESIQEFIASLTAQVKRSENGVLEKCAFDDVLFTALTDLTLRCLFSIQDKTDRFPNLLHDFANPEGLQYPTLNSLALSFPFVCNLFPTTLLSPEPAQEFLKIMESLVSSRITSGTKASPPDVIDICIEQLEKVSNNSDYKQAKVTKETILFQAFNFFFSGQEQTSLVVSCLIYHLLNSPEDIRERLYAEVDSLWEDVDDGSDPSREKLLEAEYLQACINEALRLYPLYGAERTCTKDWFCEKYNFKISKGMTVLFPLWAVNRNPDYFEKPEEFNPDRFLGESKEKMHPYAWSSFGHGKRSCVGKPLALEVFRITCAYLFRQFKFQLRKDTELNFHPLGPMVFVKHEPIYFDISLRQ